MEKEHLELLETITANWASRGCAVVDENDKIIFCNSFAAKRLDSYRSKMVGKSISALPPLLIQKDRLKNKMCEYTTKIKDLTFFVRLQELDLKDPCLLIEFSEPSIFNSSIEDLIMTDVFDKIINCFFDGVYVTRADGLTLKMNRAYEELTGISPREVIGYYMEDIVKRGILSPSATAKIVEEKKGHTFRQVSKTGRIITTSGVPIFDSKGNVDSVVFNVRDITELANLKEDLQKAKDLSLLYKKQIADYTSETSKNIICESASFSHALTLARQAATFDSTVLIMGESGVGKEIVANEIVNYSQRNNEAFIKINCGAIQETLIESELFGYVGGAFTGAKKEGRMGAFELANKGTIFLDEIGEIPYHLQVNLLRAIQERKITRVGSSKEIPIDIRIISATNKDLKELVNQKLFRADLYYRLNVVPITVPPLRERKEDIIPLTKFFIEKFNKKHNLNKYFSIELYAYFRDLSWEGNVRELENAIEFLLITATEDFVSLDNVEALFSKSSAVNSADFTSFERMTLKEAQEELEKTMILNAMNKYGSTVKVAKALDISQPSVSRKYAKYKSIQK